MTYDVAVIGGGIVGLAHAFAAARLGKRVVVIEREPRANGASIRNFGFITVTGQARGETWRRARRSRDIWDQLAPRAGIEVTQRGLMLLLRYPESTAVAEAFVAGEMGEGCILMSPAEAAERLAIPGARAGLGALWSPHEIRVESRAAVPALAGWLAEAHGVAFMSRTAVLSVAPPRIETSHGPVAAGSAVVCPGDDLTTLFPDSIAAHGVEKASLTMLRLEDPGWRLPATLMSDLGLARYLGYAALPPAEALRRKLERTDPDALAHGIHLIVAQGSDGRLIVGDSHHYGDLADPFMDARVEALILEEFRTATGLEPPPVATRWAGSYARAAGPMFVETPLDGVRLVMVTSGTGASTAFAIAEEVVGEMFGADLTDLPLEGKHT